MYSYIANAGGVYPFGKERNIGYNPLTEIILKNSIDNALG